MCKISVVIPIYNVEPYLKRCLDSVVNQTLSDIEIILINDCSTDNSLEIAKSYKQNDKRIILIDLPINQGAAVARNKGLEVASGEYLGFVDPDDAIDLNFYEELYKKAKETDADIVKAVRERIQTNGKHVIYNLNEIIKKNSKYFFTHEWQTAIYKSSMIYNNNIIFPPEIRKSQDIVFLNRAILKSKSLELINNVKYYYYKRNDSLDANKISIEGIKYELKALEYILEECNQAYGNELPEQFYIEKYYNTFITILNYTITQNDSREAKELCIRKHIKLFNMCKDCEKLAQIIKGNLPDIVLYTKNNEVDKMVDIFMKYENIQLYLLSKIRNKIKEVL